MSNIKITINRIRNRKLYKIFYEIAIFSITAICKRSVLQLYKCPTYVSVYLQCIYKEEIKPTLELEGQVWQKKYPYFYGDIIDFLGYF